MAGVRRLEPNTAAAAVSSSSRRIPADARHSAAIAFAISSGATWSIGRSVLDELPAAKAARVVRKVLLAGVKAEGPIHVDRLTKLTVGAFGLTRSSEARKQALLSTLPPSAVVDDYLWPEGTDPAEWTAFRRQVSSTDRPIDHVAPEEIANAMAALCRASAGMRREELLTAAAAVFGSKRRTPATTPALEAALKWALHRGRLTEQPNGLLTV